MAGFPPILHLKIRELRVGQWPGFFAILLLLLTLASCQNEADNDTSSDYPETNTEAEETTFPPPVVMTFVTQSGYPSFSPESPNAAITPDPIRSSSPLEAFESYPEPLAANHLEPTVLPTDQPTYTPPASPTSSPWDHYWFRRPVPEGSAVWTDKAYPYGATRGGMLRLHRGVEFNVPHSTAISTSADGKVVFAGQDNGLSIGPDPDFYGQAIVIEHEFTHNNQPVYTLYGHLSQIEVEKDQSVKSGELIAYSGASGVADGPHLHFEVRVGQNSYNSTRNPLLWLFPFPNRGVVAGNISWSGGSPAVEVPLTLRRLDAPSPYASTTTYAAGRVNGDDNWTENFAFDDVESGYYALVVGNGESKETIEFWVYPAQTNFVELTLQN